MSKRWGPVEKVQFSLADSFAKPVEFDASVSISWCFSTGPWLDDAAQDVFAPDLSQKVPADVVGTRFGLSEKVCHDGRLPEFLGSLHSRDHLSRIVAREPLRFR